LIFVLFLLSLFVAAPTRAGWRSLTGLLPDYTDIDSYQISPDSRYVVFLADLDVDDRDELYSVPITGSLPSKLNPLLVNEGDVRRFGITPDGQRVIYTADQEVDNRVELYSVPIGGGAAIKLNGALVSGGNVDTFKIDPDSVRVVYVADGQTNEVFELFSVPIGGGTSTKLNPTPVSGGDVNSSYYQIDAIGNRVVYAADLQTDELLELYGVAIGGGASIKLNPAVYSDVYIFDLNPSLPVVVFEARQTGSNSVEVFSNATSGGLLNTLNFPLASNQDVFGWRVSPDGARVVYNVVTQAPMTTTQPTKGRLYSVLIGGSTAVTLTEATGPNFGVYGANFSFTPNSQRVVYLFQQDAAATIRLQSVTLAGANRVNLYVPPAGEQVYLRSISPDSQWVLYESTISPRRFNTIPPTGGTATPLQDGYNPQITPDSSRVIYIDKLNGYAHDLQSLQIFGGGQRNLSHLGNAESVGVFQVSPDGQWIVFEVYRNGRYELRVSDGTEGFYTYLPVVLK
jgi:Tol biopolymer transport system component